MVDSPNLYDSLCNAYNVAREITSTPHDADTKFFQEGEKVSLSETERITGYEVAESIAATEERNYNEFSLGQIRYWCDGQVLGSPDGLRLAAGQDFLAYNSEELTSEDVAEALGEETERREKEIQELADIEDRL